LLFFFDFFEIHIFPLVLGKQFLVPAMCGFFFYSCFRFFVGRRAGLLSAIERIPSSGLIISIVVPVSV
jgi:hypothetical protein